MERRHRRRLPRGSGSALLVMLGFGLVLPWTPAAPPWGPVTPARAAGNDECKDYSTDPAGCQPSTFDTPLEDLPGERVNRHGRIDPFSSEKDARAGFARLERELRLFRNFQRLHWVITVPSVRDPATGAWRDGDLDGLGDGRGLGIAGACIYVGHTNGVGVTRAINVFKIQRRPEKDPPVQVGEIPAFVEGNRGFDDREIRALLYRTSGGEDRMLVVRNATTGTLGRMETYRTDPETCLPISRSTTHEFEGQSHEFYLWHDPTNSNRVLVFMAMFDGGGRPDPHFPGGRMADLTVYAITDETTGEILMEPLLLGAFTLQDVGGPLRSERRDATGLFSDGRTADYSHLTDQFGNRGNNQTTQNNALHSLSVSDDGERIYVAGGTAGFYVLNSEAIARSRDADLAAGTAGCNLLSTNVWVGGAIGGAIDASKLPQVANDCIHMVVNDDPGLNAFLASGASAEAKVMRYLALNTRSRFDVHPPHNTSTGIHSAVFVPNRPAQVRGNTKGRPAYVWISDENGGCPINNARIVTVESEAFPMMVGAFAVPDNLLEECLAMPAVEPNGQPRRGRAMFNHNPTVFKNLVFTTWYGQGLRAIDISRPQTPREVGHAVTAPHGQARTYPVFKDGLMYWVDNDTGLHVARYTGPRADELPGPGSGTYEGNATSPHR